MSKNTKDLLLKLAAAGFCIGVFAVLVYWFLVRG